MFWIGLRRFADCLAIAIAGVVLIAPASEAQAGDSVAAEPALGSVGRKVEGFELRDFYGKPHRLADYADRKVLVVAFLGTDCPLVKLYTPRLVELAAEYGPRGVAFVAINSNHQDTVTEINAFAQRNEVKFPVLKDPDSGVADRFGAQRTPEVFVLDAQRVIRYQGRIDDQYGVGFQKKEPARRDLAEAINELLEGKPVSVASTAAPGCLIGRTQKVQPHGDVTYTKQVARILQNRCIECHREGEIAPFPLTSYEEVVGWADMICEVVDAGRMPPWFANPEHGKFANDCRMNDEEKQTIHTWVENGCPQGATADLPEPRAFVTGWRIGQPDQVFYMSEQPYDVPAEGTVDYQHFTVDLELKEDRWLKAAEPRPGTPSVVHHIVCFIQPPGAKGEMAFGTRLAAVFAPGTPPWTFPEGTAIKLPAGSKMTFQMHYTPNGHAAQDRSYVGLIWADPKEVKRQARSLMAPNMFLKIPPGADNYQVVSRFRVKRDMLLLNLFPHMHLRGKDFRFELEYADGRREVLLDVPSYDFNWQLRYDLAEPKLLPKGSRLQCVAHFDNSPNNPNNPDPSKEVEFGIQTWEEMMVGFFTAAYAAEDLSTESGESEDKDQQIEIDRTTGGE